MRNRFAIRLLIALTAAIFACGSNIAFAYEPPRAALMIDVDERKTLVAHNADQLRHPASLTKMMTLYLVFEALEADLIKLDTPVIGSRHSADRPPSRLGLAKGESISVDLAIDALVVRSANDVAAALGELLAGSEDQFAALMTQKAQQLGMMDTVYKNASGLPNKEQVTTANDQAILGLALKEHFPTYFPRFSVPTVSYKDRTWNTHNNLLKNIPTVTGIKTGFINASGFNVVTYDERDSGQTLIVVMGGRSAKERDQVAADLLEGRSPAHMPNAGEAFTALANVSAPSPRAPTQLIRGVQIASANTGKANKPMAPLPTPEIAAADIVTPKPPLVVDKIITASVGSAAASLKATPQPDEQIKRYAIQVGVLPSVKGARARLDEARPALKDAENKLRQFALPLTTRNGKTHYRARIVGFASMDAAFAACDTMETANIECMALVQK